MIDRFHTNLKLLGVIATDIVHAESQETRPDRGILKIIFFVLLKKHHNNN